MADSIYQQLTEKYGIKRIGRPHKYLGWAVAYEDDGAIILNQPHQVDQLLQHEHMADCNPKQATFPLNAKRHQPTEEGFPCHEF